ncbi:Exodeoxyribonuclease 7 large subunit [bioreactor metagenome]|uniref:Exodeoxyribonuclease 7 large subunit n=1 Tax=bioreactor metagenome TaxID=1076179 RepID=A0A644XVG5_9ZZZZ|nr:exodeoxyribonuclease VII large subunit [Paludibacter sp.]
MEKETYSLSQLTRFINQVFKVNFESTVWIKAEISELREASNGHCYLEFIEKDPDTDTLIAKMKANIWANTYRMLKPYFESSTGQQLHAGIKVLVSVTVDFHDVFGLSLNIRDIDPTYTLGELAKRRLEIIRQLEKDGVMEMNKSLELATLPNRVAVISSPTAAGYDDFCNQLENNPDGFVFYKKLFPAIMQGDMATGSIIEALDKIYEYADLFDIVIIIRGGGATTDLACFDSYELALNCAQFPLPIIAGIGHQRDLSIVDMVAHTSVKTPTAAAALLIEMMEEAKNRMTDAYTAIYQLLNQRIQNQQQKIADISWKIKHALLNKTANKKLTLERQKSRLIQAIRLTISAQKNKLALIENSVERHSPAFLLKYGYTITTINGKRISSVNDVQDGDTIKTYVSDGEVKSIVEK